MCAVPKNTEVKDNGTRMIARVLLSKKGAHWPRKHRRTITVCVKTKEKAQSVREWEMRARQCKP